MKKLMVAVGAAALCGAVMAGTGIESANIVGYTTTPTGSDNNFVTIPFVDIGCNTSDIQQLGIEGEGIGFGTESFEVWSGVPTVVANSGFIYWDSSMDPTGEATSCYWGGEDCSKAVYPIAPNQGVVINCAEGLTIKISF